MKGWGHGHGIPSPGRYLFITKIVHIRVSKLYEFRIKIGEGRVRRSLTPGRLHEF